MTAQRKLQRDQATPSGDTKADILAAADRLLPELGLAGATSRKIAAEAGTTVASINYYFGSKDGLITEVVASHMVPVMREMATRIESGEAIDEADPVRSILHAYSMMMLVGCMTDPILREAMGVLFSKPDLARTWRINNIDPYLERITDVLAGHLSHLDYRESRRRMNLFVDSISGQIIKRMGFEPDRDPLEGLDEFVDFMTIAVKA